MKLRLPRLWGGGALVELLRVLVELLLLLVELRELSVVLLLLELLATLAWRSLPLCTRLRAARIPWPWLLSWRG